LGRISGFAHPAVSVYSRSRPIVADGSDTTLTQRTASISLVGSTVAETVADGVHHSRRSGLGYVQLVSKGLGARDGRKLRGSASKCFRRSRRAFLATDCAVTSAEPAPTIRRRRRLRRRREVNPSASP